jgi:hypothetical protein
MDTNSILIALDEMLVAQGFHRRQVPDVLACWARRSLLTGNRAVVVIECPGDEDPALFAREQKKRCSKAAGFFIPFLFEVGLQIIVVGPPALTDPTTVVDTYSNQICVLQSVHVVDLKRRRITSGATWGQVVTGPLQTAIADTLRMAIVRDTPKELESAITTEEPFIPGARDARLEFRSVVLPNWLRTLFVVIICSGVLVFLVRLALRMARQ